MHAQVVAIHVCCDWHSFERINELLVNVFVLEFLQDFGPECEMLCHGSTFVVSSEHYHLSGEIQLQKETLGLKHATNLITYLQTIEENEHFKRENASVNVVSKE